MRPLEGRSVQIFKREETEMKTRGRVRLWAGLWGALVLLVISAGTAYAQDERATAGALALLGVLGFVFLIIGVVFYVYHALALSTIAKKTNTENPWLAWIPIANVVLMLNIAKKPIWWILLCLIPIVNIVIFIIVWMGIAEAVKKPNWWGILIIVPIVGLIVPGYLAWAD